MAKHTKHIPPFIRRAFLPQNLYESTMTSFSFTPLYLWFPNVVRACLLSATLGSDLWLSALFVLHLGK